MAPHHPAPGPPEATPTTVYQSPPPPPPTVDLGAVGSSGPGMLPTAALIGQSGLLRPE